jgi:hypothetical protein
MIYLYHQKAERRVLIMWKKKMNVSDERIEKESNKLISKQFYVMLVLVILVMFVKVICRLPFYMYLLEAVALLAMVLYVVINEGSQGIIFMKDRDESIQAIHEGVLSKAYNLAFNIIVEGELLVLFLVLIFAREYFFWILSYFVIWVPSALWITIAAMKKGWFIWGSRKKETEGKKNLGIRTAIGAICFGVIMTVLKAISHGGFQVSDIGMIFALAAGWGIPFYLIFTIGMKISEKKADKLVGEEKESDEE